MKKFLSTLLTTLFLTACSDNAPSLQGKNFTLADNKNITLSFDVKENRFAGKAVNNYFGDYTIKGNNITLKLIGSTMMAGPAEEMKQEQVYFENLGKIKTYTLKNNILELKGDNITLKYEQQ